MTSLKSGASPTCFFWVRERLESKVVAMIQEARHSGILMPSQASKLYGTLNFLEPGVFGRAGCGGLQPFKDHQYGTGVKVCARLIKCFEVVESVLAVRRASICDPW